MARYWLTALSPMARAFCAALSVSTRSRSFSRAGHPGTVDVLVLPGSADFRESDFGQAGVRRQLKRGDIFVTRSKTPYELDWKSPVGEELDFIIIHLAVNDDYEDGRRHPGRWQRRMTNRQMESAGSDRLGGARHDLERRRPTLLPVPKQSRMGSHPVRRPCSRST
jgi:hypothetical protein